MAGYYISYSYGQVANPLKEGTYDAYNEPYYYDTTISIIIFYPNGFFVGFSEIYDSMGAWMNRRTNGRLTLEDTFLVNTFFRSIITYKDLYYLRYTYNPAGVYKVCNDTIYFQSMADGNSMFHTWNATAEVYIIKNKELLEFKGLRSLDKKNYTWLNNERKYYFVPCNFIPEAETWLHKKKWIYCNVKKRKRKCTCD